MTLARASAPQKLAVLGAGGTGGHLFPAQALAEALARRGYRIHLMTDERVREYGRNFPAETVHHIPAATLALRKPHLVPGQLFRLWRGVRLASKLLRELRPAVLAGFGGYPSFPPVLAASRLGIPALIHEQNAVMGRANRVLASRVAAVASSFPAIANVSPRASARIVFTGNPVRAKVLAEGAVPYVPPGEGPFRLVVFGGSQGARFFAEFMPDVIRALPAEIVRTLSIVQQCRPEDLEQVRQAYAELGVASELSPFFDDMPKRIANAHLIVCRSGASTIAELGVIGRPAILVPLPHSIDNDQLRNAESFAASGAGWVKAQSALKVEEFGALITKLRYDARGLAEAAAAAKQHGRPDAAERLADLVEELIFSSQKGKA
jgi:UDP-N-acetylglucosamine--N-acetylmuramyl-(pentapeptide) pyrophosphoryl-undecaprenol N-acetylglucosamine transferase